MKHEEVKKAYNNIQEELRNSLPTIEWNTMKQEMSNFFWMGRNEIETPKEKELRPTFIRMDKRAVHNLTTLEIPEDVLLALSWGPKFVFPVCKMNKMKTIPMLENMVANKFTPAIGEEAMKRASIILTRNKKDKTTTDRVHWLNLIAMRTQTFFKRHKDTLIMNSDKGKHTVIMNKEDYETKMMSMLADQNTYTTTEDKRDENIQENNRIIEELIKTKTLEKTEKHQLINPTATTAKIYGLPKIHKEGNPLRPITSTINSPGSKLATRITQLLSTIFKKDPIHLTNSMEAKRCLDQVSLENDDTLVSFDVVSMFTNIPLDLTKRIIMEKWREIQIGLGISKEMLNRTIDFLLIDCAIFSYKDVTYRQTRGLAMGSPMSPFLAQIVMTDLITKQLATLTYQPKLLRVYVDDTIGVIKRTKLIEILNALNEYHNNIQFTMETEGENRDINFLDLTLKREGNKIETNWYKKTFASDRMLNYLSNHDSQMIRATAVAHIKTVINLSDGKHFHQNKEKIWNRLKTNNFPETEIMGLMNEHYTLMKPTSKTTSITNLTYAAIPSIDSVNQSLKATLQELAWDLRITIKPDRTNSIKMSQLKDKTSINECTNTTTSVNCKCKQTKIITRTEYNERSGHAIQRLMNKYDFGDQECTQTKHTYKEEHLKTTQGSDNWKLFRKESEAIAYKNGKRMIDCDWNLPHQKMRKHL